jgi:predicted LPLAT superfamily acyltransferase
MTKHNATSHWAGINECTSVAGIWLLFWIYRALGRRVFTTLLYPVILLHWLTKPSTRHASHQYLQRLQLATGALGHQPDWRDSLRHVALFAETMLDKLLAVSGRYPIGAVQIRNGDGIDQALQSGRGGVILVAHMGCLELCRALAERQRAIRLHILVHTRHAQRFNRILRRLDPDCGLNLLEVSEITPATAAMLADKVAAGEFVAIAGDRVPVTESKTTIAPFLGYPAPFPVGPYILASLFSCPLYPAWMHSPTARLCPALQATEPSGQPAARYTRSCTRQLRR